MSRLLEEVHRVRLEMESLMERLKAQSDAVSPNGGDAASGPHLSDDRKREISQSFDPLAVWRVVNNPGKFS
jgi:hypothetical protein